MKELHHKILMGILIEAPELEGGASGTTFLTIREGQWALVAQVRTSDAVVSEVLCQHRDWDQFIALAREFSDYVEE